MEQHICTVSPSITALFSGTGLVRVVIEQIRKILDQQDKRKRKRDKRLLI